MPQISAAVLVVIGTDNQLYEQRLDTGGNPVDSYFLASPGQHQVKAVALAPGVSNIFVIGTDDRVWFLKLDASGTALTNYTLIPNLRVKTIWPGGNFLFVIGTNN